MIITLNKTQIKLTKDVVNDLHPTFSLLHGRSFVVDKQNFSLNQILKSVLKEVKNSPTEELDELMPVFKELKEKGYADHSHSRWE